jgi:hypothetical protein
MGQNMKPVTSALMNNIACLFIYSFTGISKLMKKEELKSKKYKQHDRQI